MFAVPALWVTLLVCGCDKGAPTASPDRDGAPPPTTGATEGLTADQLRYQSSGFGLTSELTMSMEIASAQGGGLLVIGARSGVETEPAADGRIEVRGKVLELIEFRGEGVFDPERMRQEVAAQGQPPIDLEQLHAQWSRTWNVDASGAEPPNTPTASAGGGINLFVLPVLPAVDLVPGEAVQVPPQQTKTQTAVGVIPTTITSSWRLVAVQDGIAELEHTRDRVGAADFEVQGAAMAMSFAEETRALVHFDLERHLPVSYSDVTQQELVATTAVGESFTTSRVQIDATYE